MNREEIFKSIDRDIDKHIHQIQRWVQQPSVSWDGIGVDACAELVAQTYRDLGCQEVELVTGKHYPGVWAYYDAGSPITLHSYCMFDTRTVVPENWSHDPWGAELVATEQYPKILVGRGAMGAKGPYVAFLNALKSIIQVEGTLPVNFMFLAEGEEIMGSPSYRHFVDLYKDRLKEVQLSYCPTSSQTARGHVNVGLGLKGMVVLELTANGAKWEGAPAKTIHSSAASLVNSPPFRLAQALATLTKPDGAGCAVEGLTDVWDYRKPLSATEEKLLRDLADAFEGRDWRDVLPVGGQANVDALRGGSEGMQLLINFLYGPTFNVAGMYSGFLGANTHTIPFIVPGSATAMLDMRMVVELTPEEIVNCLRKHLDKQGFEDIEIKTYAAFSHSQTSPEHVAIKAVENTLDSWNLQSQIWPIQAGGGPWTVVPNEFNVPCIRGSVPGTGAGGVDEYLVIEGNDTIAGLADVEKYHVDLLFNVAESLAK